MADESVFLKVSDDTILTILYKLDDDPRHWGRIACVSTKFYALIRTVCFKTKCLQSIPAVAYDLLPSDASPGFWASLYKLAVCCPGLVHSGVLPGNSSDLRSSESVKTAEENRESVTYTLPEPECACSLPDDALFVSLHTNTEIENPNPDCKRRKISRLPRSHLASGIWNLSREQGNKLLASRFKGDCLYICDWPGCIHVEEKRNYMLFRGVFPNFTESRVWRTISDGNKSKVDMNCGYCGSNQTWDLHSSFCLRRYFGFHEDGEPIVRAYVCENGHVSGAWTDWPLYT